MNKALIYFRVSSKEQEKEGFSLDAQEKLGYEYASRKGLSIARMWKVSESAWREERESFNQMVEYAKKHPEIGHIIFDVTDRMTRNDFDKMKIADLIKNHNKAIHFSRSNKVIDKNSGSEDVFMLDIEVAVAKKMSNDISRKTKMGMQEKAEQGIYPSSAPLGYKNNRLTGLIDTDPEKAPFISRLFELMGTGNYSLLTITEKMYSEGFRNKRGEKVRDSSTYHFLTNPFYCGVFKWQGKVRQGSHAPLVSKELFDKVQKFLGRRQQTPSKPITGKFHLNNLMTCGTCGCKVLGEEKKKKYTYYHCTFSKGKENHTGKTFVREEKLAEIIGGIIQTITLNESQATWLIEALREDAKANTGWQETRVNALKAEHGKLSQRLSRLLDMHLDGSVPEDVYQQKDNELRSEMFNIKSQIESLDQQNPDYLRDAEHALELCKRLKFLYDAANLEEKAELARLVASNYSLTDGNLVATMRKPFDLMAKGLSTLEWLPRVGSNHGHGDYFLTSVT